EASPGDPGSPGPLPRRLVPGSRRGCYADADGVGSGAPVLDSVCEGKCKNRCSQKVAGRCMGLCMMCCGKCAGCVPSGPLAPKDECPCYRDMKSPKSGRPKCP
uniref:Uncharacterized protein n=1 Tax=Aegilops tauschii subsp. strangulata TaxID=200361 RepID=A0A453B6L7_AEGTS